MGGATALVLAAAVSLAAHHSLTAEYDPNAPLTLVGKITRVEWTNPHAFFDLECPTPDGQVTHWRVEAGGPASLAENGVSRDRLAVGAAVTVNGFRAKNGTSKAWGSDIKFADGETRQLTDARTKPVDDLGPASPFEELMSSLPFVPYLVAAAPVVVLLAGVLVLRRRRRSTGSVPQ